MSLVIYSSAVDSLPRACPKVVVRNELAMCQQYEAYPTLPNCSVRNVEEIGRVRTLGKLLDEHGKSFREKGGNCGFCNFQRWLDLGTQATIWSRRAICEVSLTPIGRCRFKTTERGLFTREHELVQTWAKTSLYRTLRYDW